MPLKCPLRLRCPELGIQRQLLSFSCNAFELPPQLGQSPGTVYEVSVWNPVDVSFRVTESRGVCGVLNAARSLFDLSLNIRALHR